MVLKPSLKAVFILLFAAFSCAFSAQLVNFKLDESNANALNIAFSFDTPIAKCQKNNANTPCIDENRSKDKLLLSFKNVNYAKTNEIININSPFINKMLVSASAGETLVMLNVSEDARLGSAFNGRVFTLSASPKNQTSPQSVENKAQSKGGFGGLFDSVAFDNFNFTQYLLVMGILLALLILLWLLNRTLRRSKGLKGKEFRILFQRQLDKNNKFIILQYDSKRYAMVIGASNTLLNVFDENGNALGVNAANAGFAGVVSGALGGNFGASNGGFAGNLNGAGGFNNALNSTQNAFGGFNATLNGGVSNGGTSNGTTFAKANNAQNAAAQDFASLASQIDALRKAGIVGNDTNASSGAKNAQSSLSRAQNASGANSGEKYSSGFSRSSADEDNFENAFEENKQKLQRIIKLD